jgi:hypothetical protein
MDIFWKENNLNSILKKLKLERNDLLYLTVMFIYYSIRMMGIKYKNYETVFYK